MIYVLIAIALFLFFCICDSKAKTNHALINQSESDRKGYRLKVNSFQLKVEKYHPANEVVEAKAGYLRLEDPTQQLFTRIPIGESHLHKVAYVARVRNLPLGTEETVVSESSTRLRQDIERLFRLWTDLTRAREQTHPELLQKKIELAQSFLEHQVPRLVHLYTSDESDTYATLYAQVKKHWKLLEKHGVEMDEDIRLSFLALESPEEEDLWANVTVDVQQLYVMTEVPCEKNDDPSEPLAATLLEIGDAVKLVNVTPLKGGPASIKVQTTQSRFVGYLDPRLSIDVCRRWSSIRDCRVTRKYRPENPSIEIRIEF